MPLTCPIRRLPATVTLLWKGNELLSDWIWGLLHRRESCFCQDELQLKILLTVASLAYPTSTSWHVNHIPDTTNLVKSWWLWRSQTQVEGLVEGLLLRVQVVKLPSRHLCLISGTMLFSALAREGRDSRPEVYKQSKLHEAPDLQGVTAGGEAAKFFSGSQQSAGYPC